MDLKRVTTWQFGFKEERMEPITVLAGKGRFEMAGKPSFYLADTVWSAFTNTTIDE